MTEHLINDEQRDILQEIANTALLQSAHRLTQLLEVAVVLSNPNVSILNPTDIDMMLHSLKPNSAYLENTKPISVCQGFIGGGIAGETLLIFNAVNHENLAQLLKYALPQNAQAKSELVIDAANIFNGACLRSIAEQLDIQFNIESPTLLVEHFIHHQPSKKREINWKRALAIEVNCTITQYTIHCDLLIVIPESSIYGLIEKLNYLID